MQPGGPDHARYAALDGYRALAACFVMLHHYGADFRLGLESWSPAIPRLSLLVDFFFILSGFVIMTSYGDRVGTWRSYGIFLRRRLARLYPLHLLVLAAFVALAGIASLGWAKPNHPEHLALAALPANLLLVQAWGIVPHASFNVPAWSISAEWFVYLCFPAMAYCVRVWPLRVSVIAIAALLIAFALVRAALGLGPWTSATFDFGALRAVPNFFAGVVLAALVPKLGPVRFATWPIAHALFAAALLLMHWQAPAELILGVFVLLIGTAALAERAGRPTRLTGTLAQRLGAASYAIYMLHVLAAIPVLFVLRRFDLLGTPLAVVAALGTAFAVVVSADIVHRHFELPWQRRLSGPLLARPTRTLAVQPT